MKLGKFCIIAIIVLGGACHYPPPSRSLPKEIRICVDVPAGSPAELSRVKQADIACSVDDWEKLYSDLHRYPNLTCLEFVGLEAPSIPEEVRFPDQISDWQWYACDRIGTIRNPQFYRSVKMVMVTGSPADLPEFLRDLKQAPALESLTLNGLGGGKLPDEIFELKQLRILDLGNNDLTAIPETLSSLENLEYVYLHDNQLRKLPGALKRLPRLKYVLHADNPIVLSDEDRKFIRSLAARRQ